VRQPDEAGALNQLIAPWAFIDDHAFITKTGEIGLVYRMGGVDYEGLDPRQRDAIVHRFAASIRPLGESFRLYQYLMKQLAAPFTEGVCAHPVAADAIRRRAAHLNGQGLYQLEQAFVLLMKGVKPRTATSLDAWRRQPLQALRSYLSSDASVGVIERELIEALTQLHRAADSWAVQLADTVRPVKMAKAEAFRFFRRLVNYAPHVIDQPLRYDTDLDFFIADSQVDGHPDHLQVGDRVVRVLTMKEPPSRTFADVLEDLRAIPAEFIACLEWQRIPAAQMRRDLWWRQRHFWFKGQSATEVVGTADGRSAGKSQVDPSAGVMAEQIGAALIDMEVHGRTFGQCSLTVAVYGVGPRGVERGAAEAIKVLAKNDGVFFEERYGLLRAWRAMMPGNHAQNIRRLALMDVNYADLSVALFTIDRGEDQCAHLGREPLAVLETTSGTPYALNLHVKDVGHALISGFTGSGKSYLMNFLSVMAQKYDPQMFIFDVGHSYKKFASLFGGSYLEVGQRHGGVRLNPFSLTPTSANLDFLHGLVRVLLEGRDGKQPLKTSEEVELYDAIVNLYDCEPGQRRLLTLATMMPPYLKPRFARWVDTGKECGQYSYVFDNVDDTLTLNRLQVFEFEAMKKYPDLLEPLFFYILHRVADHIADGRDFTICPIDEAWEFVQHPMVHGYIESMLKTGRKKNVALILGTQSLRDFKGDLLRTAVENCPTKLLLANPSFDREEYRHAFQLNDRQLDLCADLRTGQMLLKRSDVAKVLTLNVDPHSHWLYTNNAADNERLRAAVAEHGLARALDVLAAASV
jgi:type IV secretion/conjugal transfer VirB4 family ATPase